ncbi:DNA-dependent RNA polymerase II [Rhizophlyctis rosea]|nr:DNA-dependent RNA polymerase II [Rhizophlyctis rosea]
MDQGGYFIINGSEKVLIAQERMATNHMFVFSRAAPSASTHSCKIKSVPEEGTKIAYNLFMKLMAAKHTDRGAGGQTIKMSLLYIKAEIPIMIVFEGHGDHVG